MNRPAWTLAEASQHTGVSVSTLRRALRAERIEGAFKDTSGSWRLPLEGLLAAGYTPRSNAVSDEQPSMETTPRSTAAEERVRELEAALKAAVLERDAAREISLAHERRADSAERALRLLEAPSKVVQRSSTDHGHPEQADTHDHDQQASPQVNSRSSEHPAPSTDHGHGQPTGGHPEPRRRGWWARLTGRAEG